MNPGTTYHLLPQYSLEDTPFLKSNDSPENDCCTAKICTHPACLQRLRRLKLLVVLESLALVLLWGVALGLYTNRRVDSAVPKILYCKSQIHGFAIECADVHPPAPAQDAVEYEIRVFHEGFGSDKSIYQKDPSPEVDNAWDEMYNCMQVFLFSLTVVDFIVGSRHVKNNERGGFQFGELHLSPAGR